MTNADKYKEVFGMTVDHESCPTRSCSDCPCGKVDTFGDRSCVGGATYEWWDREYKEGNNVNN